MSGLVRSLLGVMSPVSLMLTIWRRGEFVGTDQIGNKYYRGTPRKGYKRERRWVIYKDEVEASLVPPEWHGWMHHQTDAVPANDGLSFRKPWQLPHQANLTGTDMAYRPEGSQLARGKRAAATGDYQPWTPE